MCLPAPIDKVYICISDCWLAVKQLFKRTRKPAFSQSDCFSLSLSFQFDIRKKWIFLSLSLSLSLVEAEEREAADSQTIEHRVH